MPYSPRIILHAPPWNSPGLDRFVEDCIRDQVVLVCVIGTDCQRVEDVIDELVVNDGSDPSRFLNTTSHDDEPIDDVRKFAASWTLDVDPNSPIQEVDLRG